MGKQLASGEGDAQWVKSKPVWVFCDQKSGYGGAAESLEEVTQGDNEAAIAKVGMGYRLYCSACSSQC